MDDIRIQIVNYKTRKYLLECLDSFFNDLRDSSLFYNVAALDNASGDDLSDLTSIFPDKKLSVTMGAENPGFGEGHNILARNQEARYLLLLNPDIKFIEPIPLSVSSITGVWWKRSPSICSGLWNI